MGSGKEGVTHLPAGAGRSFALMGSSLTFKYEPEVDGGGPMAFEHRCPPGMGVPTHSERNHEAFYVLEGTLDVEVEGETYRLGPGDFLGLPPGVVHSLHNSGPDPARVLTIVSPGSGHARFFSTLGERIDDPLHPPQPSGPPDLERVLRVGSECGIEFRGPGT